jgi:HAD superfamily hydrolase (TIGR01509 family)
MGFLGRTEIDRDNADARRVLHTYSFNDVMEYFFAGDPQRDDAFRFAKTVHYRDLMPYMRMEDGFVSVLDQLKGNTSLAICTNRATSMDKIIEDFGLTGYFDFIMTASQVTHPKPDPEPLLKVLDYFEVKPDEALFIGDGEVDMQAANSAGVPFISYKSELPALARLQHHSEIIRHVFSML